MKLEVGMYVRTKHNGIGKIVEYINDPTCYFFKCYKLDRDCSNCDEYITKADVKGEPSHNIIDLIEVGDYVNGMKVNNIAIEDGLIYLHMDADDCLHESTMLTGDEIESIVTKEQFEQMQYRVGD